MSASNDVSDYQDAMLVQDYEDLDLASDYSSNSTTDYECFPNGTVFWPGLDDNSTDSLHEASMVSFLVR